MEESLYGQMELKTWVLKVSIHCESCKKKVIKLLAGVEGVHRVDVDLKHQSVMVTGNVHADTLVNKLIHSGRQAQLWCQIPNHKNQNKVSGKEKRTVELPIGDEKLEKSDLQRDSASAEVIKGGSETPAKAARSVVTGGGVEAGKEEKLAGDNKSEDGSESNHPPSAAGTEEIHQSRSGDGKVGKRKIKKGRNGYCTSSSCNHHTNLLAVEKRQDESSVDEGPRNNTVTPARANKTPPRQHSENPHVPGPSPPVYVMSYNMASTAPSHTTSYYTSPPPQSPAHEYRYQERERIAPPSDPEWYPRPPLVSFEMFSDENPNGCSIM